MHSPNSRDADLLKSLLEPLLEDFQHWFMRSRLLLETEDISFLSDDQKADLLARIATAQQEVSTAQMLFKATDGQVGVEPSVLAPWHNLVTECWQIAVRFRLEQSM
jgi:hypothetical protein